MSQTRTCPVCGRPGLPANCASCPQCDADLTCFQALDTLASPKAAPEQTVAPKKRTPWAAIALLATLVLLLLAGLAASMKSRLSKLDQELAAMRAEREKLQQSPALVPQPVPVAEPALPPESKIHIDGQLRILDERAAAKKAEQERAETIAASPTPPAAPVVKVASPSIYIPKQLPSVQEQQKVEKNEKNSPVPVVAKQEKTEPPAPENVIKEPIFSNEEEQASAAKELEQTKLAAVSPPNSEVSNLSADATIVPETVAPPSAASEETAAPVDIQPEQRKRRVPQPVVAASAAAPQPSSMLAGSVISYAVKEGENVWDIAQQFYGDRKYYPVVMELNPQVFLGFIRKGSEIWLYADRREAAALYQRRIEQKDGLLLWKYEVRPGETWRSIHARFFPPRYSGTVFYGDQDVAPGKTVRLILR